MTVVSDPLLRYLLMKSFWSVFLEVTLQNVLFFFLFFFFLSLKVDRRLVYKSLWQKGFFLTSGINYGADFLIYEGTCGPWVVLLQLCVCVCVTMKKSARRMACMTSDTGDTSSKQQEAQHKRKLQQEKEARFISRSLPSLQKKKEKRSSLLNLHMLQSTCFGT